MTAYIVTGSGSGLGEILANQLSGPVRGGHVWGMDIKPNPDNKFHEDTVDLLDSEEIARACKDVRDWYLSLQRDQGEDRLVLVHCAGVNEIEWLRRVNVEDIYGMFAVNAVAPVVLTQQLLPMLNTCCIVTSNASHMAMRCSIGYNMSKAAAHMAVKQLARELGDKPHDVDVWGFAPNKLEDTGMSAHIDAQVCDVRQWTADEARAYQLAGLPAGRETSPVEAAAAMAFFLRDRSMCRTLRGCVIDFGGPSR
jgi:NAD(P)-dependent dehydrogenase (short-subunit alcohol dehydrogenase family)